MIAAEGEHKASRALRHAAEVIAESPSALQVNIQKSSFMIDDDDAAEVISKNTTVHHPILDKVLYIIARYLVFWTWIIFSSHLGFCHIFILLLAIY